MAIKLFEALAEPSGTRWQIELPSNFPSFNYLRSSADFVMRLVSITLLLLCLIAGTAKSFAADQVLRIDLGEGQVIELVLVKHGSFVQGSPTSEKSREDDELQHKVTLTKDFYISKTPSPLVSSVDLWRRPNTGPKQNRAHPGALAWSVIRTNKGLN